MDEKISTQVLDSSRGRPVEGLDVRLEVQAEDGWREHKRACTDSDGRVVDFDPPGPGVYRMTFHTGDYYALHGLVTVFPQISVSVRIVRPGDRLRIPLLVSPYAYAAYGEIDR